MTDKFTPGRDPETAPFSAKMREDQRDLVYRAIKYLSDQCHREGAVSTSLDQFSLMHTRDRLRECLPIFDRIEPSKGALVEVPAPGTGLDGEGR